MPNIFKKKDRTEIKVDAATTVYSYGFSTKDHDLVELYVNGEHGTMKNNKSTKTYYVISGFGEFYIDDAISVVEQGDIISVKPNEALKIVGKDLRLIIISNPPFRATDEEWL